VIALYYFLADGPALVATAEKLIPISIEYQREIRKRFDTVVRAVITATFFSAIGQGLATALMLCFYYGFGNFVILFILATFASMVPLFGTWLVWGPCVIWLLLHGIWLPALVFLIIGVAVIGTMDNVIRTYVLQSDAQLHPLLAFVSVLGGVQVMGLWGVFIAPIVASILHALIVIFNTEISVLSKERQNAKLQFPPEFAPQDAPALAEPDSAAESPPVNPVPEEQAAENA
jgi:predicted PurR-regulated permease PerM